MEPIIIKTVNGADDTYAFYRESGAKNFKTNLFVNCLLFAGFALVGFYTLRAEHSFDRFALCGMLISLWSIINVLFVPSRQKKAAAALKEREGDTEMTFAFYDDHLTDDYKKKVESGHIEFDYSGLYKVVEIPKHLFIFTNRAKAFIIRREDIPEDVLPQLRELLRGKLPFSAYEIKNR